MLTFDVTLASIFLLFDSESKTICQALGYDMTVTVRLMQWDSFEAIYTDQYATHNPDFLIKFEITDHN